MRKRFFLRRCFAYIIDVVLVGLAFSIAAFVLNRYADLPVVAPDLVKWTVCEPFGVVPSARQLELLPPREGEQPFQRNCVTTVMGMTKYREVTIGNVKVRDGENSYRQISYISDASGNPVAAYTLGPFYYLALPFILAWQVSRRGTTFGKSRLDLVVLRDDGAIPTFTQALKREAFKFLPFLIFAIAELPSLFFAGPIDLQASVAQLDELSGQVGDPSQGGLLAFALLMIAAALLFAVVFVHQFGSFIVWRGKTWWDRLGGSWTGLPYEPEAPGATPTAP